MNKEEIEKELKLSKRQNKDKRYDYLDSKFNAINYCIKLEKYTNKLLQENKQLKNKLIEINEVINGYMPNVHAMCKAFDEIEFILSKEVE